jgi:hypothetical protein
MNPSPRPQKPLPTSNAPAVFFPVPDEVFITAWSLFIKRLVANYHHDLGTATTPQLTRNISRWFNINTCTLLDVYETRIQNPLWQPLGGRVFMDLAYRRFTMTVTSTYPWRSTSDIEKNAERNARDDAMSVFQLRYLLTQELDRYMAGPKGFLRRAIADRDAELASLWKEDVEMRRNDVQRRAKDVYELRGKNRVLEWVRGVRSTEDEYWDIVNRQKIAGKRASTERECNGKRMSKELGDKGYESASDEENIPSNGLERNDSVIRQQSAKEGGWFPGPNKEAEDDDEDEDYYTADEGDADFIEEENAHNQKANDETNRDEYDWNSVTEEAYGAHSDDETLAGSEAPRRSSRKGSFSSSSDGSEAKEAEEEEYDDDDGQQEIEAGEMKLGSEMAGENMVVAF